MQIIIAEDYPRLMNDLAPTFSSFAKERPSTGMKEQFQWLIDTAGIQYVDKFGGDIKFSELMVHFKEFENQAATSGFEIPRFKLEDIDGGGIELAAGYARQIAYQAAYWPVKQVTKAVRDGGLATSLAYDGQIFFSTAHPVNPVNNRVNVVYANDFTGGASGIYPGACPIDASVTLQVAFDNLMKVIAYVRSLKAPDGDSPRKLRVKGIAVPPALQARALQLTNAKFIAQAVSGGGGSGDIEAIVSNWGLGQPLVVDELASNFTNGSDTTWYLLIEQNDSDQVGAIGYSNREPFKVVYNGEMTDAQLSRSTMLQWVLRGRNTTFYMHPYLLFRVRAA
jgi:phage major head subunit gpT-like protein